MSEVLSGLVVKNQDGTYSYADFGVSANHVFYNDGTGHYVALSDIIETYVNFANNGEFVYTGADIPSNENISVWINNDGQSL